MPPAQRTSELLSWNESAQINPREAEPREIINPYFLLNVKVGGAFNESDFAG